MLSRWKDAIPRAHRRDIVRLDREEGAFAKSAIQRGLQNDNAVIITVEFA